MFFIKTNMYSVYLPSHTHSSELKTISTLYCITNLTFIFHSNNPVVTLTTFLKNFELLEPFAKRWSLGKPCVCEM